MAFSNNKVSFTAEEPNASHEDHIWLFFFIQHTQRENAFLTETECKKCRASSLFHAGYIISTFIRLIKR